MSHLRIPFTLLFLLSAFPVFSSVGWGGWNDTALYMSGTENNNYAINTLRVWLSADFSPTVSLYVRAKHQYVRLLNPTNGTPLSSKTQSVIDLDLGYFRIKSGMLSMTVGRGYYLMGKGVLFNGIADGLGLDLDFGKIKIALFGNYTGLLEADSNPYNFSSRDISTGAKRLFTGLTVKWLPSSVLTVYAAGLLQRDLGDEMARYHTLYGTAGVEIVWAPQVKSALELIYQAGESPTLSGSEDIGAFAAVFSTKWLLFNSKDSGFYLDAAYASGSDNRVTIYPNSITSGKDKQFYSFGVYSTGFSYEPDLANLIYASLGFQFRPFGSGLFRDSVFRADYSYYRKADADAPVSEFQDIIIGEASLGMALDVQYIWRIVSDVSLSIAAGAFKPGAAYSDRDLRLLGYTTLNIAF